MDDADPPILIHLEIQTYMEYCVRLRNFSPFNFQQKIMQSSLLIRSSDSERSNFKAPKSWNSGHVRISEFPIRKLFVVLWLLWLDLKSVMLTFWNGSCNLQVGVNCKPKYQTISTVKTVEWFRWYDTKWISNYLWSVVGSMGLLCPRVAWKKDYKINQ